MADENLTRQKEDEHTRNSYELWAALQSEHPEYLAALEADEHAFAEIGPEFLGFVTVYKHLAAIIPVTRTVYDFGCSYAPQAWYFRNHKAYVGVNPALGARLHLPNTRYFDMTAEEYVATQDCGGNGFAIVNYVPDPKAAAAVKATFKDMFTYYPRSADLPRIVFPRPTTAVA